MQSLVAEAELRDLCETTKVEAAYRLTLNLPSVRTANTKSHKREQEKQRVAQEQIAVNRSLFEQGAPAAEGSPQGAVEFATGLDRDGVEAALARIEASNPLTCYSTCNK